MKFYNVINSEKMNTHNVSTCQISKCVLCVSLYDIKPQPKIAPVQNILRKPRVRTSRDYAKLLRNRHNAKPRAHATAAQVTNLVDAALAREARVSTSAAIQEKYFFVQGLRAADVPEEEIFIALHNAT